MKKLINEQKLKKDRLSGIFVTVLVLLVVGLAVTRILIANRLVEASEKLRTLDQKIEVVKEANQSLSEQLRQPQSITFIEEKAKALGFKTSRLVFLAPHVQEALGNNLEITLR